MSSIAFRVGICLALLIGGASAASAAPKPYRFAPDYSDVRGFNYQPASTRGYTEEWLKYPHDEIDRDLGYAEKLRLNTARVFLSYNAWLQDKAGFRTKLQDFVRTANRHGIRSMIVLVDLPA